MKNPMWFIEEKVDKVKNGQRALERELVRSARSLSDNVGLDARFAAELVRQVIHRLILTMTEIGLVSIVRQLMPARPPARIYALPVP
jgi:hypothetical protein